MRTSWEPTAEALERWILNHQLVWIAAAVPQLAFPNMLIEPEVKAIRQE
jgi:hypothetical protein